MTEQQPPGGPQPIPADYLQQAEQAVQQAQSDPGTTAEESLETIKSNAVRAALGDFEQQLAAMMASAQKSFDSQRQALEDQLAVMTRQLATVRAQAGPPDAQRLADSVSARVKSIAIANPDLGTVHFAGVISQGEQLAEQVKAIAEGQSGDTGAAENIARGMASWFTRAHPRISGKILEGSHAALDELERIIEELPELMPVAAAVAKVV